MSNDEKLILDYLKQFPGEFVSSLEIARRAGSPRRYNIQPGWASVVLKRLETEAVVERDFKGRFRIKPKRAKKIHEGKEIAAEAKEIVPEVKEIVPEATETVPEATKIVPLPKEPASEAKPPEPVTHHYWVGPSVVQADDDQPFATILESLADTSAETKKAA